MSDQTLAEIMAAAHEIDRVAEQATTPDAAKPVTPPAGQPESLEALETRLRGAHDQRVRDAAQYAHNEELLREALAQRGVRLIPDPLGGKRPVSDRR